MIHTVLVGTPLQVDLVIYQNLSFHETLKTQMQKGFKPMELFASGQFGGPCSR